MKRIPAFSLLSAICLLPVNPQTRTPRSKLSPHLQMLASGDPRQEKMARDVLLVKTGRQYPQPTVGAFVRFEGDADSLRAIFAEYGASINTVAGDLATAEIPIKALESVAGLPNVIWIEESSKVKRHSDVSVPATGANQLWYGSGGTFGGGTLDSRGAVPPPWQGNTGKNVMVGIVDSGIDLTHKDFIDAASGHTRNIDLWDQEAALRGDCHACYFISVPLQSAADCRNIFVLISDRCRVVLQSGRSCPDSRSR